LKEEGNDKKGMGKDKNGKGKKGKFYTGNGQKINPKP
jgi:hypothetical protein